MEVLYKWIIFIVLFFGVVNAQEETVCYGPGSIAASVILTFLLTSFVVWAVYFWRKKRKTKTDHLILESDPEKGKGEYAFDNPGFKDASYLTNKSIEVQQEKNKSKWNQWSPLSVLNVKEKPEKKKTLDDSALGEKEVKVISLRSEDFTGLGFNICGNMREGIYIKDVLQRGPAFDSGKLNSGDRINSVTINFEHMVYEDALAILSYASPYEVVIEAKGGKLIHNIPGQGGEPGHPLYKSSSHLDLYNVDKSSKKKINDNGSLDSNYSSLKKSISNMTTLERKESHSPNINVPTKKQINPEHLKVQLEQRMEVKGKDPVELETQKTTEKFPKFGIRVLPKESRISPKSAEQNDNNINIEKHLEHKTINIDEVDNAKQPPPVKKREKKAEKNENFERNSINNSGIKRDKEGIPLELPEHMLNAATAAMNNRKSINRELFNDNDQRKKKGKAPLVPEDININNYDEIQPATEDDDSKDVGVEEVNENKSPSVPNTETKCYNSDSDAETDNNSSVNTIELNSSDITIHQTEEEEKLQNRKTASTGDLSKIKHSKTSNNTGTLERAQSLDITDSSVPIRNRISEDLMKSDEDLFRSEVLSREPRLSLILDGLNTFQRNRLKKSTEWGNLEDAILKLDQEDEKLGNSFSDSENNEYHAVVNKINEIKRESEIPNNLKQIRNEIWPDTDGFAENMNNIITVDTVIDDVMENEDTKKENSIFEQPLQKSIAINNRIFEPFESPINELNDIFNNISSAIPELNKRQRIPDVSAIPPDPISDIPLDPISDIIHEWDSSFPENITNTSPPHSLETEDTTPLKYSPIPKPEEVLSKIPLLNSMVKNQKEEALKQTVLSSNITDETKTVVSLNALPVESNLKEVTRNFLYTEQLNNQGEDVYCPKAYDVNVSDDIKVSRHSYESLERKNPKYDTKSTDAIRHVSNINVINSANGDSDLHSLELSINESQDMYTTAVEYNDSNKVVLNTPDLIKNVTLTEAINTLNDEVTFTNSTSHYADSASDDGKKGNASHTYVTEIKVTPNNHKKSNNVSEIEIISDEPIKETRNLDKEFENYVKSFEAKLEHFENNINQFDNNLEEFIKEEPVDVKLDEKVDELQKIQKIAEQQLKKLPEMKFTTSSYESSKIPEKRQSQVELLKSNFEKSPTKPPKPELSSKSRIPIATTKTPPTSPERRDSRNLENENDKAILELMSSSITSTPFTTKIKPPNKNVTVTSIRTSSKIPSGLPTLGGTRTPRKIELNDENIVQVSTNGNVESSFKQWVFNPSNVTNVTVTQNKDERK